MKHALLGNTGLIVSRLAFGAMTFTAGNKNADRPTAQALGAMVNR